MLSKASGLHSGQKKVLLTHYEKNCTATSTQHTVLLSLKLKSFVHSYPHNLTIAARTMDNCVSTCLIWLRTTLNTGTLLAFIVLLDLLLHGVHSSCFFKFILPIAFLDRVPYKKKTLGSTFYNYRRYSVGRSNQVLYLGKRRTYSVLKYSTSSNSAECQMLPWSK